MRMCFSGSHARRNVRTVAAGIAGVLGGTLIFGMMTDVGIPVCSLSTNELDLGLAEPGMPVTGTVMISNAGNRVLEIREVKPSCGCTVVELDSESVAPGESTALRVRLVPDRSPRTRASVAVATNDPERPVQMLEVRTERRTVSEISAERVVIHVEASEKSASRRLRLTENQSSRKRAGTVFAVSSSERVKAGLSSSQFGSEGAIDVSITATDAVPRGLTEYEVRIYDSTHRVEHNVDVEVRRDSEWLQLERRVVCFSDIARKKIELSLLPAHSGCQFRIRSATLSEQSPLRAEIGDHDSKSLDLLPSAAAAKFWRGYVQVEVGIQVGGIEQVDSICIPVMFVPRESRRTT